jgi:hypothetical protein
MYTCNTSYCLSEYKYYYYTYGEDWYNNTYARHKVKIVDTWNQHQLHAGNSVATSLQYMKYSRWLPVHEVSMGSGSHCPLSMHVEVLDPVIVFPVEQL